MLQVSSIAVWDCEKLAWCPSRDMLECDPVETVGADPLIVSKIIFDDSWLPQHPS